MATEKLESVLKGRCWVKRPYCKVGQMVCLDRGTSATCPSSPAEMEHLFGLVRYMTGRDTGISMPHSECCDKCRTALPLMIENFGVLLSQQSQANWVQILHRES